MNYRIKNSYLTARFCSSAVLVVLLNAITTHAITVIDPNVWKFGSFDGQSNVSITVTDVNGVQVTFGLTSGWGQIDGNDSSFSQINLYPVTETAVFSIKTTSGKQTSVGNIFVDGSLGSIQAKTTDLRGDITIAGTVGKIELDDIDGNHIITIGSSAIPKAGVLLKFDEVNDLTIDSNTPIKVLMCTQWLDNDANEDQIIAPSLGTLQVRGDKRRLIDGDFEASLLLDGSNGQQSTLVNAKITGDVNNHTWDITGDVRTLQAGGWFNSSLVVGGNVASLKLNQLHGDVDIAGNAKNVSITEPMAACAPETGEIGTLQVDGQASVKSGRSTIKFSNDTLYTSEPNIYRLEDLRRYDVSGAWWDYTSTYKISGTGVSESGTTDSDISVTSVVGGNYTVRSCALGNCSYTSWYTDATGTHMNLWDTGIEFDTPDGIVSLSIYGNLDVSLLEREFLVVGELYRDSGLFDGQFNLSVGGDSVSLDMAGTANTTCKLVGHEQVTVPSGIYVAAKVETYLIMTGTLTVYGESIGKFTATQKQTCWGVPDVGIVKVVSSMTEKIGISGAGSVSMTIAETDQLTDYGP